MSGTGFFSDKRLQQFALSVPFTAFVETGTCEGDTARWIAEHGRSVFTCEIDAGCLAALKLPEGVHLYAMNSPQFLIEVKPLVGGLPLIFLDAHWFEYWPLRDELHIIATQYHSCVIIVHDCLVPNKTNFWACRGGGRDNRGDVCSYEYMRPSLDFVNKYRLFYPTYDAETPGYCVLFQNCEPCGDLSDFKEGLV